ncbi:hypothetical protein WKK05_11385 [Nostoc sp. UHCC 0302]|uniref:hypothetical protein n=1 Tax=Nostoc sp. UHCC 0302 TaxID=3134896 RepID=UPI00311C950B
MSLHKDLSLLTQGMGTTPSAEYMTPISCHTFRQALLYNYTALLPHLSRNVQAMSGDRRTPSEKQATC